MKQKHSFVGIDDQLHKLQNIIDVWQIQKPMINSNSIKPRFLSIGPSGSGKTSTLQYLTEQNKIPLLQLSAPLLSPTGYKGSNLNSLFGAVKKNQTGVLFIDEFDKLFSSKHQEVIDFKEGISNELLNILGDGKVTIDNDSRVKELDFSKWLVVLAGAFEWLDISTKDGTSQIQQKLEDAGLTRQLLGRINDFVVFPAVSRKVLREAIEKKLQKYLNETRNAVKISYAEVLKMVDSNNNFERFGFRAIDHAIFQLTCLKKQKQRG